MKMFMILFLSFIEFIGSIEALAKYFVWAKNIMTHLQKNKYTSRFFTKRFFYRNKINIAWTFFNIGAAVLIFILNWIGFNLFLSVAIPVFMWSVCCGYLDRRLINEILNKRASMKKNALNAKEQERKAIERQKEKEKEKIYLLSQSFIESKNQDVSKLVERITLDFNGGDVYLKKDDPFSKARENLMIMASSLDTPDDLSQSTKNFIKSCDEIAYDDIECSEKDIAALKEMAVILQNEIKKSYSNYPPILKMKNRKNTAHETCI